MEHTGRRQSSIEPQPASPGGDGIAPGKRTRVERRYGGSMRAAAAVRAADGGAGQSVPDRVRHQVETQAGADLSSVRVHTGAESAAAAAALHADAYTSGPDIHFGAGKLQPETADGQQLLLHELGHTLQQRGATPPTDGPLEVSQPGDAGEHEADSFAESIAAGRPAAMPGIAPASINRRIARFGDFFTDLFDSDEDEQDETARCEVDDGLWSWMTGDDDGGSTSLPTGGEQCTAFAPEFGEPVELEVDFNQPIEVPIDLDNLAELSVSGVETDIRLLSCERQGAALYDTDVEPLTFRGVASGGYGLALLSFTADQEGTWDVHAGLTFTDPDGSTGEFSTHVAIVTVGRNAALKAENVIENDADAGDMRGAKGNPGSDDCDDDREGIVFTSHFRARRFLATATAATASTLSTVEPQVAAALAHWFSIDRDDRASAFENGRDYVHVQRALTTMQSGSPDASYECGSFLCEALEPTAMALDDIVLCDQWFASDDDERAGILVHEWGHKYGAGVSRAIETYDHDQKWSGMSSSQRVAMPDAYEGFVVEIATGKR